jgi:hypothetical protein
MQLPIGSTVRITTTTDRFTGTLLATDDQGVTAQPRTRVPEALRRVAFGEIRRVELVSDSGANLRRRLRSAPRGCRNLPGSADPGARGPRLAQ